MAACEQCRRLYLTLRDVRITLRELLSVSPDADPDYAPASHWTLDQVEERIREYDGATAAGEEGERDGD